MTYSSKNVAILRKLNSPRPLAVDANITPNQIGKKQTTHYFMNTSQYVTIVLGFSLSEIKELREKEEDGI